jgi:bis(5'-nucleosyl)-tetraphosphatase (symmetrical)
MLESRGVATYAIGDVQGCFDSFESLLDEIGLQAEDRLWLVGDLVNRGPKSLEVLRWVKAHDDQCIVVLGNHDLHLLAMAAGLRKPKGRDTAQQVLDADDGEALIDWLRSRPLVHCEDAWLLVHAGVHPSWTTKEALAYASELESVLAGDDWRQGLETIYGGGKETRLSSELDGEGRLRAITAVFTRMRCLRKDGGEWILDHRFDGEPDQAAQGLVPWYQVDRQRDQRIIFGHWAALGLYQDPGHLAVDTGCVWGNQLTCVRLDDGQIFTQPAID